MRIPCPLCGERDGREFTVMGAATFADRPGVHASAELWDAYLHLRDNPAGQTEELWYHQAGCGAWLTVRRDTATHAVAGASLASERPS